MLKHFIGRPERRLCHDKNVEAQSTSKNIEMTQAMPDVQGTKSLPETLRQTKSLPEKFRSLNSPQRDLKAMLPARNLSKENVVSREFDKNRTQVLLL